MEEAALVMAAAAEARVTTTIGIILTRLIVIVYSKDMGVVGAVALVVEVSNMLDTVVHIQVIKTHHKGKCRLFCLQLGYLYGFVLFWT